MKKTSAIIVLVCIGLSVCGCGREGQTEKTLSEEERKLLLPHSETLSLESKQDEIIQSEGLKYNDHFKWYERDEPVRINGTDFVVHYSFEDNIIEYLGYYVETQDTEKLESEFYDMFIKLYGEPRENINDALYEWRIYTTDERPYKIKLDVNDLDASKMFTISYSDASGQAALEEAMDELGEAVGNIGSYASEFIEGTK